MEVYSSLAAYEMGEFHLANGKGRLIGDLALAEVYLNRVLADKTHVSLGSPVFYILARS